jgi:hypothetical protein
VLCHPAPELEQPARAGSRTAMKCPPVIILIDSLFDSCLRLYLLGKLTIGCKIATTGNEE